VTTFDLKLYGSIKEEITSVTLWYAIFYESFGKITFCKNSSLKNYNM